MDMIVGLRSFLIIERPLKMMKNVFYFVLKTLLFPEIFIFLSRHFSYVEKRLDEKAMINFKIYDVRDSTSNSYNLHIGQYLKKYRQPVSDL